MNTQHLTRAAALSFAMALLSTALAADTESSPAKAVASADYQAGKAAVEAKQWTRAADHFRRATLQDPKNADAWNMLGYSSRWAGKYPDAFDAYAPKYSFLSQSEGQRNSPANTSAWISLRSRDE